MRQLVRLFENFNQPRLTSPQRKALLSNLNMAEEVTMTYVTTPSEEVAKNLAR